MIDKVLGYILLLWIGLMFIFIIACYDDGYKKGQIDAINGNIKYELVTNPDKSTKWVRISERK